MKPLLLIFTLLFSVGIQAQTDPKIYDIIDAVSEERLRSDVKTLADFGTRHTLSDTLSETRGIGAARRCYRATSAPLSPLPFAVRPAPRQWCRPAAQCDPLR